MFWWKTGRYVPDAAFEERIDHDGAVVGGGAEAGV